MTVYTVSHERIPELPGAGRLGRHVKHDSRNLSYLHPATGVAIVARTWARNIGILDQGSVGSCTGNAETGALGTSPLYEVLSAGHPALDETLALRLYSEAETLDGDGPYPPQDNGSSGQSVCQAAKTDGLISGYTWCQDEISMLDALMAGPVIIGINWYDSFDSPDAEGIVALPKTASIRGGHEIVAREVDVARQLIGCDNSWGTGWGLQGRFYIPYTVMTRLFSEQGDCAVPLPLSVPAPTPVPPGPSPAPTPTPPGPGPAPAPTPDIHVDSADQALAGALPRGWATEHHVGENGHAAKAVRAWLHAKGLS